MQRKRRLRNKMSVDGLTQFISYTSLFYLVGAISIILSLLAYLIYLYQSNKKVEE